MIDYVLGVEEIKVSHTLPGKGKPKEREVNSFCSENSKFDVSNLDYKGYKRGRGEWNLSEA
jgi:hypothetical protein